MEIRLSDGSGVITRFADLASRHVPARPVDVYCPTGYAIEMDTHYPVIYMHDGQNLFEATRANFKVDWGMDEAVERYRRDGLGPGAIIVGVWNREERWREYMPARPLESTEDATLRKKFIREQGGLPSSDAYLKFLVEELKPLIDTTYRTQPGRDHTFIMGSSMGGLISLYALEEHPEVFGGAGCLSTHWPAGGKVLVQGLGSRLPAPGHHRLYFDYGTRGLDSRYGPGQRRMDEWLRKAGYTQGVDWISRKFDGTGHDEQSWRERVDIPLRFLLGGTRLPE